MQAKKITHGSLFSGIGGFDYAGELCGIKTLWVCEIEPAPVAILKRHFPGAVQLGNIMEVHGGEIAPVDVLTFGSPCQGMSVAGTRCGLDSDQSESVLFYEAVRIIYEMREATNGEYPKIIIWENVPGAYSSNKGMDFRAVLETLTKSTIPMPQSGRWATSGMVRGGAVDIAWRTPDAQYWGVPQRRKRIKLIGDFTGGCAARLLFECDRLSGYFAKSREQRQGTATDTEDGAGTADRNIYSIENHANDSRVGIREDGTVQTLTQRMGTGGGNVPMVMQPVGVDAYNLTTTGNVFATLTANSGSSPTHSGPSVMQPVIVLNDQGGSVMNVSENITGTLRAQTHGNEPIVVAPEKEPVIAFNALQDPVSLENKTPCITQGNNKAGQANIAIAYSFDSLASNSMKSSNPNSGCREVTVARTIDTARPDPSKNQGGIAIVEPAYCLQGNMIGRAEKNGPQGNGVNEDVSFTLNATDKHAVAYSLDRAAYNQGRNAQYGISIQDDGTTQTMVAKGPGVVCAPPRYIVRRLTPMECERLQGFPDGWTEWGSIDWAEDMSKKYKKDFEKGKMRRGMNDNEMLKKMSDSARYKGLGNAVDIPTTLAIMATVNEYLCDYYGKEQSDEQSDILESETSI